MAASEPHPVPVPMSLSPRMSTQSIRAETPSASSQASQFSSLSMNDRQKHDSFTLSGSVVLITADGRTVSLPLPSQSPYDPLNWNYLSSWSFLHVMPNSYTRR